MKTKLLWLIGSVGALSFASLQGCGDDDEASDGSGGTGGSTSGKGGSTAKGGSNAGGDAAGGDDATGGTPAAGGDDATGGTPAAGGDDAVGGDGAGGGGGDARMTACEDYCIAYIDACADDDSNTYENEAGCITTCVASDWEETGPAGNTIQCREIHAGNAAAAQSPGDIADHCGHAADDSTGICVD